MEKVSDVHNRLFHYTNWAGLQGILDSQSIWATNINYLNDQSEYQLAREPIYRLLLPRIDLLLRGKAAASRTVEKIAEENGGIVNCAKKFAQGLTNSIFRVTGNEFFVASFCGKSPSKYVDENGLLSQWRGYGIGGGFAIVFNSKELEVLLDYESKLFDYGHSLVADAVYSDDEKKFDAEFVPVFEDFMKYADVMLSEVLFKERAAAREEESAAYSAVPMRTTRYKHLGFREENEVRIVAKPTIQTPEYIEHFRKLGRSPKPPKKVEFRTANSRPVPYIKLFGFSDRKLPIEKIIVGPSENKNSIAAAIRKFVSNTKIEATVSDIPCV